MSHRKVIEEYYCDLNNLTDLLSKLTNNYRVLIGGAGELNSIALAHKKDIKNALHRANELGDIIDKILNGLGKTTEGYVEYCKMRAEIIKGKMLVQYMETEINEELFLNSLDDLNSDDDIDDNDDIKGDEED
ncbi:hypothetical protein ACJDU8_11020 [Clostridium sp. WILCCON 0269]|uniref:Uncharacterized protein n=1 Tax=Candidatus Clostridium eludens TaxID=3381663 RepID=A0ABW8SJX8_9CLOT